MGLRKWLIKKLFKINFSPNSQNSDAVIDQHLKDTMADHQQTLNFAKKLNKAALMKQQTQDLLDAAGILNNDDDDDEEPATPNMEDKIIDMILPKLLGGGAPKPKKDSVDFSQPAATGNPDLKNLAGDLLPTLTAKQKKILQEKGIL